MPEGFFDPLPGSNLNRDELLQWFSRQTISAQKLITGAIQTNQEIESSNFVTGTSGWQITGDGDAEFNDVVVRGDIESSNWDGTSPANLSSRDGGATAGFYLDSSEGAAQFEGSIWVGGTLVVDGATSLGSTLTMGSGGTIRTASSGERVVLTNSETGLVKIYDSSEEVGRIGVDEGTFGGGDLVINNVAGFGTGNGISFADNGTVIAQFDHAGIGVPQLSIPTGSVSMSVVTPGLGFMGDPDTGIYRVQSDFIGIATGGTQRFQIGSEVAIVTPSTTGSAANLNVAGSGLNNIRRSTSSLVHKPDWRWAKNAADYLLPTPIRWTDEKGQIRLGFGAEHVWGSVPEAYEDEVYDLRSLVAILSEKVKRLEGRTSGPRHLPEWLTHPISRARDLLRYRAA